MLPPFGKPIEDVTEADLQGLIEAALPEGLTLDYKEDIDLKNNEEIAKDISSFANAQGGLLIYGVVEEELLPRSICGCTVNNIDKVLSQLQNICNTVIRPRIPGLKFKVLPSGQPGRPVILVEIPRSFAAPHQVNSGKFLRRYATGKKEMDVDELRQAFGLAAALTERVRTFRRERVEAIADLENRHGLVPFQLDAQSPQSLVVHVIPLQSSLEAVNIDVRILGDAYHPVRSILCDIMNIKEPERFLGTFNLDGYVARELGLTKVSAWSYLHFFRNGIFEYVKNKNIKHHVKDPWVDADILSLYRIEEATLSFLSKAICLLDYLKLSFPVAIALSVTNTSAIHVGHVVEKKISNDLHNNPVKISAPNILVPELVLQNPVRTLAECKAELRPMFDTLWNAAGYPESSTYNTSPFLQRKSVD